MSLIDGEAPEIPAFLDRRLTHGQRETAWQALKVTLVPECEPVQAPAPLEEW